MKCLFLTALPTALALALSPTLARADSRHHDGFYLRLGAGAGYALATLSAPPDGDSHAVNVATELAAGWSLRPGLTVGLGTYPMVVPKPDYGAVDAGGQHVSGTGPFVDYYFRPSGGLHLQGALLVAAGYLDGSDQRSSKVGVGYGMMAGAGYDRFISAEWSLGALVRMTVYRLFGVDDQIRLVSPSLLVTATFN